MKTNKLRLVVDTNILLASLARFHKHHWLFKLIKDQFIQVCLSNEIIFEYHEKVTHFYGKEQAELTIDFLLKEPTSLLVNPKYRWNLISADPDDNKFVDCYLAADADDLVTNDKHFNVLKGLDFPKVNVISIDELKEIVSNEPTK